MIDQIKKLCNKINALDRGVKIETTWDPDNDTFNHKVICKGNNGSLAMSKTYTCKSPLIHPAILKEQLEKLIPFIEKQNEKINP